MFRQFLIAALMVGGVAYSLWGQVVAPAAPSSPKPLLDAVPPPAQPPASSRPVLSQQQRIRAPQINLPGSVPSPYRAVPAHQNLQGPMTRTHQRADVILQTEQRLLSEEEVKQLRTVDELKSKIRAEKDEIARATLGDELTVLLETIFDADLTQRDEQLKKLEERVGLLRSVLEKQRQNRDRIIKLQIETVMLDAEGLAFPAAVPVRQQGPYTTANSAPAIAPAVTPGTAWQPAYGIQSYPSTSVTPIFPPTPASPPAAAEARPRLN